MFAYSLSGLQIDQSAAGTVLEVEENEITARSAVYQVFGRIFTAPDAEHAAKARDGGWVAEMAEAAELLTLSWEVGEPTGSAGDDAEHAAEYEKLFGVHDGVSVLWSGTYVEDRAQHQDEISRSYEYYGLGVPGEGVAVDSLSAELDYMQFLAFKEAAASSPRLGKSFRRAQKDFLDRTLGVWVPTLVERSGSAGPFWAWSLERLSAFVAADAAAD